MNALYDSRIDHAIQRYLVSERPSDSAGERSSKVTPRFRLNPVSNGLVHSADNWAFHI